jgi:4-aminobutyrate---pyruvate transaminase
VITEKTSFSVANLVLGASPLRDVRENGAIVFTRGQGCHVTDASGRSYLDATSAFYCAALGFGVPALRAAALAQMDCLSFQVSAGGRSTNAAVALSQRLAALTPFPDARVLFGSSGSEANDFSIKLIRQANVLRGSPQKRRIISRRGSYHGTTTLTAGLGGSQAAQDAQGLDCRENIYVGQPSQFFDPIAEVEAQIVAVGAEHIAAFIAEPVSFSAGFVLPPPDYYPRLGALLRHHNILLIADEIITGLGRLGMPMGWEAVGMTPDVVTIGKALTNAYSPMSAALIPPQLYHAIEQSSDLLGALPHVSTYGGHPVAAAIASATLELLSVDGLWQGQQPNQQVFAKLVERVGQHPGTAQVRVMGMAAGIDLHPREQPGKSGRRAFGSALAQGIIVRPVGDTLIIAPPLNISVVDLEGLEAGLLAALDDCGDHAEAPSSCETTN